MRKKTELGFLKIGDTFYFNGEKYKANSLGNKDQNNVMCVNIATKKREWLDVTTDVEIVEGRR